LNYSRIEGLVRIRLTAHLILAGLLGWIAPPLPAQTGTANLAVDSSDLYEGFFQFHGDFTRWLAQRKAVNRVAAQSLDLAAARHFKIEPAELPAVANVSQTVVAALAAIDAEQKAYVNRRARFDQFPEPSAMQQFATRRGQAVLTGTVQLRGVLSPASWASLRDYINNVHRLRYRLAARPGK
jgi:hypothetical protein